mgnify:CR=1 FL=1
MDTIIIIYILFIIHPPSKSYAHRLLIAAALTKKDVVVKNLDLSEDIIATISCLKSLGKEVVYKENTILVRNNNCLLKDELVFNCNESGSTLRFLIPIALTLGKKVTFIGTARLIERGIEPYIKICEKQNIKVVKDETSISFEGSLKSDNFEIVGNISSQFITGLLFALPLLKKDSTVNITTNIESKNYIDITLDVLKQAKINIEKTNNGFKVFGNQEYQLDDCIVEGDYSNASFIASLNYFDGNIKLLGLNEKSLQGDKKYLEHFKSLNKEYSTIDISDCIDLGPILFAFASLKHGGHFINTKRLKIKESNRINDLVVELNKFGIIVKELENEVFIDNTHLHRPNEILEGHNDHRIVMALSIMLTQFGGTINGTNAIKKSYPNFFKDLKALGIEVVEDAE